MNATRTTVGLLHPGAMGAAFGAQLCSRETSVLWCPEGRSPDTARRADLAGLEAVPLPVLLARADVVLSLCPPAAAEDVAAQVAVHGFSGKLYVEANAIAPQRMRSITTLLSDVQVIDAAVVGSPPVGGKRPTLYLAGPEHTTSFIEALFAGTDVLTRTLGAETGKASALKLAYSSYQKASRVLAALAYGAADAHGVADELMTIAGKRAGSYLSEPCYIPTTAARAWRWGPELADAAALLSDAGLPPDLMHASADTLGRWDNGRDTAMSLSEALALLRTDSE